MLSIVVSIPSMLRDHGVVLCFENKQVNGPSDNSVHKGTNKYNSRNSENREHACIDISTSAYI